MPENAGSVCRLLLGEVSVYCGTKCTFTSGSLQHYSLTRRLLDVRLATKSCSNEEAETVDPDSVFTITQTHLQHLYGHLISLLQMMSCGTDAKNIWMAANHLSLVRNVGVAFTTTSKLEREVLFDAFVSCCGLGKSSSDGL